jgi:hypothetical protein
MINGIGPDVGAPDSVLCTAPFRLVGVRFPAVGPGCMTGRRLNAHRGQSL